MKRLIFSLNIFMIISIIWGAGMMYGKIPWKENNALHTLFNTTGGNDWNNKTNWNSAPGTENTWRGVTCDTENMRVLELNLAKNNLKGTLPVELGDLSNLVALDLSGNSLTGSFPGCIRQLKNLKRLNLSNNLLSGPIPPWIGELENLEELRLDNNMLSGPLPKEFEKLAKLKIVTLNSNRLNGEIPSSMGELSQLENNESDFRWNALYTSNKSVRKFLNQKQVDGDWESTQTVAPSDIKIIDITDTTIKLSWKPITYTNGVGGIQVDYWKHGTPAKTVEIKDKTVSTWGLECLEKRTKYHFNIKVWTVIHQKNKKYKIESETGEFTVTTRGIVISGTIRNPGGKAEPHVTLEASNNGGITKTDQDGKYILSVPPGWSGIVTPSKECFEFFPPIGIKYTDLETEKEGQDYIAVANTIISGKITYKGKGIPGIELIFLSREGERSSTKTDDNGQYVHVVPPRWAGTVTPQKDSFGFEPHQENYDAVTGPSVKDYTLRFPVISGRVTDRQDKGIPGIKLLFSNVAKDKYNYLSDTAITDENGTYRNDILTDWSGSITPKAPGKKRAIFFPAARNNLSAQNTQTTVDFKMEPDFKLFIAITGNYMIPAVENFSEIYSRGVISPEIIAGYIFYRDFYIWSGFSFFTKSGASLVLKEPTQWKQRYFTLGFGYYKNAPIIFGWEIKAGAIFVNYSEEAFGVKVSGNTAGIRIDGSANYKLSDRWYGLFTVSYLLASDKVNDMKIKVGGIKTGIGLGFRF
jgi:hypothetical protein